MKRHTDISPFRKVLDFIRNSVRSRGIEFRDRNIWRPVSICAVVALALFMAFKGLSFAQDFTQFAGEFEVFLRTKLGGQCGIM